MDRYIARANIDHFLDLLADSDVDPVRRTVIVRLLRVQLDKQSHHPDQLKFVESRTADGQVHFNKIKCLRNGLADPTARAEADALLAAQEAVQKLLQICCERLRADAPHQAFGEPRC